MNFSERQARIESDRKRRDAIMAVAAPDYAQSDVDVNANFARVGSRMERIFTGNRAPKYKAFAVYFLKHMDAIEGWLAGNEQKKEPIEGRIDDAINYLEMLLTMIAEDKARESDYSKLSGIGSIMLPRPNV
jgi:hypothetical protein